MQSSQIEWLLQYADSLHLRFRVSAGAVDLNALLLFLEIKLVLRHDRHLLKSSGQLNHSPQGGYSIIVITPSENLRVGSRERFTIGHELGHYFLITEFNHNPLSGKEYFKVEDLCNLFACRLLVPQNIDEQNKSNSAHGYCLFLRKMAFQYQVSLEVIARAVIFEGSQTKGAFLGKKQKNRAGNQVILVQWVASGNGVFNFKVKKHLIAKDDQLASQLLLHWTDFSTQHGYLLTLNEIEIYGYKMYENHDGVLFVGVSNKTPLLIS